MGRRTLIAVLAVLLVAVQAEGAGRKAFKAGGSFSTVQGLNKGLTFHAPFDDPSNPLKRYSGGALTFTRAHDATHTATYVHATTGLVTVADNNQLRIEANGALIEGASTNLLLRSDQLDNSVWDHRLFDGQWNYTASANDTISPDGTLNADTLTTASAEYSHARTQPVTLSANTVYTMSAWTMPGTDNSDGKLVVAFGNGGTFVSYELSGVLPTTAGWSHTLFTFTTPASGYDGAEAGITFDSNVIGKTTYLWGVQVEAGYGGSYIPTTTATMARNEDYLTAPISNIDNATGSFVVRVDQVSNRAALNAARVILGGGIENNGGFYFAGGFDDVTAILDASGNARFQVASHGASVSPLNVGGSWGGTDKRSYIDDVAAADVTFSGDMGFVRAIGIGTYNNTPAAANSLWGHVKDLRIWNRVLTPAEFQMLQ